MSQSGWLTRGALGAAGVVAIALIAGCGNSDSGSSSAPSGSTTSSSSVRTGGSTTSSAASGGQAAPIAITDSMGDQFCDSLKPQLSDWRVQGPTLSKVALNIAVHDWALRNGGPALSLQVLGDKALVDRMTTTRCPDVRSQALQALELSNLAAGIAF